jgi:hypothetical protein
VEVGAMLTDDDRPGVNLLASEALDAQSLCARVAAVLCGAETFFVCHI